MTGSKNKVFLLIYPIIVYTVIGVFTVIYYKGDFLHSVKPVYYFTDIVIASGIVFSVGNVFFVVFSQLKRFAKYEIISKLKVESITLWVLSVIVFIIFEVYFYTVVYSGVIK